jgi:hypothetical protein
LERLSAGAMFDMQTWAYVLQFNNQYSLETSFRALEREQYYYDHLKAANTFWVYCRLTCFSSSC